MSLKWTPKDPDSGLTYSIDWSRFLGSLTITASEWFIIDSNGVKVPCVNGTTVDDLIFVNATFNNTTTSTLLDGGELNRTYKLVNKITFGVNAEYVERTVLLTIREQ